MLSALNSWGLFRFRWVAIKFAITVGGLYLGIWWLGRWLDQAVLATENGGIGPVEHSVVWGCALIAAMTFAAWLAVVKPWGQLRAGQRARRELYTRRPLSGVPAQPSAPPSRCTPLTSRPPKRRVIPAAAGTRPGTRCRRRSRSTSASRCSAVLELMSVAGSLACGVLLPHPR